MGFWNDLFTRRLDSGVYENVWDTAIFEQNRNLTLKNLALETCANYIARVFSKSEFVVKQDSTRVRDDFYYKLNMKPNPNQTAAELKSQMAKRFINYGDLLVVMYKNNFYVASSFVTDYSLLGNSYSGVVVDFTNGVMARAPAESQALMGAVFQPGVNCFYICSENSGLEGFVNSIWEDYGKLFGSLIANQLRVGQIRGTLELPEGNKIEADESENKQKSFFGSVLKKLESAPVAIIPTSKGREVYHEVSSTKGAALGSQIGDLQALKAQYIDDVADILGIPNSLMHGDKADNDKNFDLFVEVVMEPFGKKVSEAFEDLLLGYSGYKVGKSLSVRGYKSVDILALADKIDKLAASGVVTVNQVLDELGLPQREDGDQVIMTKNYQKGENSVDENSQN
ncbi:MAG: phage portal protein [Streptococcaceae bacterium]|jgi:HK97 family phage portal protein|nr:phage portal protein [Streptococcaceae bacterium]